MTVVTTRPGSTSVKSGAGATLTGAATVYEALNDDSDSSYVALGGTFDIVSGVFETPSIPAGAVVLQVSQRVRCALASSGSQSHNWTTQYDLFSQNVSWSTPTTITLRTFTLAEILAYGPLNLSNWQLSVTGTRPA